MSNTGETQRSELDDRESDRSNADVSLVVTSLYQPIVSLPDGVTVGYEALARWPQLGNPTPENVLAQASATGDLDRLDLACIHAAIDGATSGGMKSGGLLLVNSEPASAYVSRFNDAILSRGFGELQVMFELTERSMLEHPQALLRKVNAMRSDGFAIALDDVGAHPDSLALLDIVCPDIIKLDVEMVQSQPSIEQTRTLSGVLAHHERTGCVILAEGIETHEHLEQALAMGASLGQGFKYGNAGHLDGRRMAAWSLLSTGKQSSFTANSPFDLVASGSPLRTARKQTLTALSRHIENQARYAPDPPIVLTALQRSDHFTPATRRSYRQIARISPLVAVFGRDLPKDLGSDLRSVPLHPADPLCAEWTVAALGPHTAAALLGREHQDDRATREPDRRFDFVITYDRELVTRAVRNLLDRMI